MQPEPAGPFATVAAFMSDPRSPSETDAARQLARHAKAALLHLGCLAKLAAAAGLDPAADDRAAGPHALIRTVRGLAADLDVWATGHAYARGAGEETLARTERWCHTPGGVLPAGPPGLPRLAVRPPGSCSMPWGVCPEHGNTLVTAAGLCRCGDSSCGRTWTYDRDSAPCAEPARWRLTDAVGESADLCDGHALDACNQVTGARVRPITA
ncbi:hypothetical protein Misp01_62250 [Microtetraspora sp. NBRC 13810]|uniref:hypothetical protein n=1 Tax=Microtetraspora sp. NBRC 13810 TaxID=3030990 RepID=UPI0024A406EC|nr:hypothetical protein [Microtetraspora sp. NBRC 13810]GLW11097.1 hypothetical protein Misp01_62250 [Microtetraspora sp. NBRC 13810]